MLRRVALLGITASSLAAFVSCTSGVDRRDGGPRGEGADGQDAGTDQEGSSPAQSPTHPSTEIPGDVSSQDPRTAAAGGAPSHTDAGAAAGAANAGASSSGPDPEYGESVVIDDGVLHVWTLGDSITVGVNGGFRNDIYNLLSADGFEVDMVGTLFDDSAEIADGDHEGHTAYTFQLARDDVDGWLESIPTPDVVLMLLGSNDFAWWTNEQPAEHMVYCVDLVNHVLEKLPKAALVIATLPPQSSEIVEDVQRDRAEMVEEFNDLVREQVPEHALYGKRLFLADVRAELDLSELYDGIHPTRDAHREVADAWYSVLSRILPAE